MISCLFDYQVISKNFWNIHFWETSWWERYCTFLLPFYDGSFADFHAG